MDHFSGSNHWVEIKFGKCWPRHGWRIHVPCKKWCGGQRWRNLCWDQASSSVWVCFTVFDMESLFSILICWRDLEDYPRYDKNLNDFPWNIFFFSDPPEIQVDAHKHYYHPKLEQKSLTISCNVSADPAPDVNWQRGRKVLTQHNHKNKYQMKSEPLGDHTTRMFILMISDIREEDFGNYTCHATNSLGLDKHEIVVSGKPLPPTILPGEVISKTEFRLRWGKNINFHDKIAWNRWGVHSAFPVWEHNIYYERIIRGQVKYNFLFSDSKISFRQILEKSPGKRHAVLWPRWVHWLRAAR